MSVAPKIAVTTDSVLVEQEPSHETRRRLKERKTGPDKGSKKETTKKNLFFGFAERFFSFSEELEITGPCERRGGLRSGQ